MKLPTALSAAFFFTIVNQALFSEENVDNAVQQLVQDAQLRVQRDAIQAAGKPMFNNLNDWQRWANQLNNMPPRQLNGLLNILNATQRRILAQRQQLVSQFLQQQWLQQQLWMQQQALSNLPFGMLPRGFNRPTIYYAPIVQWFPQGVHFNASAVLSPDRRHVRMNLNPFFSSIGQVYNYNVNNGAYYRSQTFSQPWGYDNSLHGVTRRTTNSQLPSDPTGRRLPDWYKRIRNNP